MVLFESHIINATSINRENDKLIAPYGMLVEKDKEIERLNRLIGRLQYEIEELKKGSAQTENPVECANAV